MTIEPTFNLEAATPEEIDELLELLEHHKAEVARIEAALKENPPVSVETGAWRVNIATASRFDTAAFERDHPEEAYPELYIPQPAKVDTKKLTEIQRKAYSKPTAPRLTIKNLTK